MADRSAVETTSTGGSCVDLAPSSPETLVRSSRSSRLPTRRFAPLAALAVAALSTVLVWASRPPRDAIRERIVNAYASGIGFLAMSQRGNGEFPTYHWFMNDPAKIQPVTTVFTASQVLYSLAFGGWSETASRVSQRTIAYLLAEREPPGVWRFYGKAGAHLLSTDVDDTAMAWAALALYGYKVAPDALAQLQASRNTAGLLNTWIGDPATWVGIDSRDTDLVVNLNALLLFALTGRTVDEVCRTAVAEARAGTFQDRIVYYPSPLAFTYAFSRAYADGGASCLGPAIAEVRHIALGAQRPDGTWGNDFETALGVVTLLNTGYRGEALERGIGALLARQSEDGGWAIAPAYRAAVLPVNYGSRALTTAVCLEALGKYPDR